MPLCSVTITYTTSKHSLQFRGLLLAFFLVLRAVGLLAIDAAILRRVAGRAVFQLDVVIVVLPSTVSTDIDRQGVGEGNALNFGRTPRFLRSHQSARDEALDFIALFLEDRSAEDFEEFIS